MSHSSYVLMDANDSKIDWQKIYDSFSSWVILLGEWSPPSWVFVPLSDEDVKLLLPRAQLLIADSDRFSKLAEDALVPFVLVDETFEVMENMDGLANNFNSNI